MFGKQFRGIIFTAKLLELFYKTGLELFHLNYIYLTRSETPDTIKPFNVTLCLLDLTHCVTLHLQQTFPPTSAAAAKPVREGLPSLHSRRRQHKETILI